MGPWEGFQGNISPGDRVLAPDAPSGREKNTSKKGQQLRRSQFAAPQVLPAGTRRYFMDGSGKGGWGVVSVGQSSDEMKEELCGPVVIDSTEKPWVGARRITNNTAELTALIEALENLHHHPEIPAATVF